MANVNRKGTFLLTSDLAHVLTLSPAEEMNTDLFQKCLGMLLAGIGLNRGSYMSAHVLLNLLNKLENFISFLQ